MEGLEETVKEARRLLGQIGRDAGTGSGYSEALQFVDDAIVECQRQIREVEKENRELRNPYWWAWASCIKD